MSSWEYAKDVKTASGRPVIGPYLGKIVESVSLALVPDGGDRKSTRLNSSHYS